MFEKKLISAVMATIIILAIMPAMPTNVLAAPGPTDYAFTLQAGKSYEITNTSTENITITNYSDDRARYDIVSYFADGREQYRGKDGWGSITVIDRGKVRITVKDTFQLDLYVKGEDKNKITIIETTTPAIYYFTLQAGKSYEITNTSTENISINNYSDDRSKYDIVTFSR